jgi:transcriptional regulator with XRE-family HTH domain
MILTEQEKVIVRRIARLVRATRKQLGFSQEDVAQRLGIIQSALSRIETGSQMLTAAQWAEFCNFTGVSPDSIVTGYVDLKKSAVLKMDDREGTFRIPRRYSKVRGSKVRAVIPFLRYFESLYGEEGLREYLKARKIDPDFFICLDNQISLNFILDIAEELTNKGALKPNDFTTLTKPVSMPEVHGTLHYLYETKNDAADLLNVLIPNSRYYECNFDYAIEAQARRYVDLSVLPGEHLQATKYRGHPVLGDFLCRYKKHYFEQFTSFGGTEGGRIEELQCHYAGHNKCVYRVNLAS